MDVSKYGDSFSYRARKLGSKQSLALPLNHYQDFFLNVLKVVTRVETYQLVWTIEFVLCLVLWSFAYVKWHKILKLTHMLLDVNIARCQRPSQAPWCPPSFDVLCLWVPFEISYFVNFLRKLHESIAAVKSCRPPQKLPILMSSLIWFDVLRDVLLGVLRESMSSFVSQLPCLYVPPFFVSVNI